LFSGSGTTVCRSRSQVAIGGSCFEGGLWLRIGSKFRVIRPSAAGEPDKSQARADFYLGRASIRRGELMGMRESDAGARQLPEAVTAIRSTGKGPLMPVEGAKANL
jgi:hypothetical protein